MITVNYEEFNEKYNNRDVSARKKMKDLVDSDVTEVYGIDDPNAQQQAEELNNTLENLFPSTDSNVFFVTPEKMLELYNRASEKIISLNLMDSPLSSEDSQSKVMKKLNTLFLILVEELQISLMVIGVVQIKKENSLK